MSNLKEKLTNYLKGNESISLKDFAEKFLFISFTNNQAEKVIRLFIEKEQCFELKEDKIYLRKRVNPNFGNLNLNDAEFAFIDTETTVCGQNAMRIIEIGIVVSKGENVTFQYSSLFNPQIPISKETTELTKIKASEIYLAPKFEDKWIEIRDLIKRKIIVAHNLSFDLRAIKIEVERLGEFWEPDFPPICTLQLARKIFKKESCSLDSLCEMLGIKIKERHRALPDALLAKEIFFAIIKNVNNNDLSHLSSLQELLVFAKKQGF